MPSILAMAQQFVASTRYAALITLDPSAVEAKAAQLIAGPHSTILVAVERDEAPVGMIGMLCFDHPFSRERIAGEVMWWVNPDARGRTGLYLLRAAEVWAGLQNAAVVQMVAPTEDVARIYLAKGYTAVETAFQRRTPSWRSEQQPLSHSV